MRLLDPSIRANGYWNLLWALLREQAARDDRLLVSEGFFLREGPPLAEPFLLISRYPPTPVTYYQQWLGHNQQAVLASARWQQSSRFCRGAIAFSQYAADAFRHRTGLAADALDLPVLNHPGAFNLEEFWDRPQRRLVTLGTFYRRVTSLVFLDTDCEKVIVTNSPDFVPGALSCNAAHWPQRLVNLTTRGLDEVLSTSVGFYDFHDVGAFRGLAMLLGRGTPILLRGHPALVELLGAEYPLFFGELDDAADMLNDMGRLWEAREYLRRPELRARWDMGRFASRLLTLDVYRNG